MIRATSRYWLLLPGVVLALGSATGCSGTPGESCTLTSNADGTATLACPGSDPVIIRDGEDGTPGAPGEDGTSCTVVDNGDGTKTVSCDDGTEITLTDGENGACTVVDNGDGTRTISCADGSTVTVADGTPGEDGEDGMNVELLNFHGTDALLNSGEFALETNPKYFANATITDVTADAAGLVTVEFSVETQDATPVPVTDLASMSITIAKLAPAAGGDASNRWVSYIYRLETVTAGSWPAPAGTTAVQATSESSGTTATTGRLTNHGDGTYTYVAVTNLATATRGAGGPLVGYDVTQTHRVSLMMGGHAGPTANTNYDFRPDGNTIAETREIVETATCQNCHGWEFHGHGGNRLTVDNCVTCHNPGNLDANGGETIDFRVMIHRIHAGAELASIAGTDGIVWDNPGTSIDESADNGSYRIWGNRNTMHEWWEVGFPAVIENCTACHQGSGADVNNWQEVPGREACGSCHDDVQFSPAVNHPYAQTSDAACNGCHAPSGSATSIADAHDWTRHDPRNIPEYNATITVAGAAGAAFVDTESPTVTVSVYRRNADGTNGALVTGDTFAEDGAAEGCALVDTTPADGAWDPCPPGDGLWRTASLFVHGPRADNVPVLTTAARAQALTLTSGPWDFTGATSFRVYVDSRVATRELDATGGDVTRSGDITLTITGTTFPDIAAVTSAQLIAWLNGNAAFRARAIAEIYADGSDRVSIRSRNLGRMHAIEPVAGVVTTALFGASGATARAPTGSTASNNVSRRTVAANNDPRVSWGTASDTFTLRYALDPVQDLESGTYTVNIEFNDAGNLSNSNYRTPTVAEAHFQVGTATEEPFVARNCQTCHQGPEGTGFVLDYLRHHKIFDDDAIDQCTACHDYIPQYAGSTSSISASTWTGSRPISRRVHAIHYGSSLNYPLATVDYSNGDPVQGRHWNITLPQDVRNCEVCHTSETSGTWATAPSRLPCSGCHDSDAAMAHMRSMTGDPTPADPWSGDEVESCSTCH